MTWMTLQSKGSSYAITLSSPTFDVDNMVLFKGCFVSTILLARGVVSYPQPVPEPTKPQVTPPQTTPPLAEDGSPRPSCGSAYDCHTWAAEQCKETVDSGLLIKAYCFNLSCYALCPPFLPGIMNSSTTYPPDYTDTSTRTRVSGTTEVDTSEPTLTVPIIPPMLPGITARPGDGNDGEDPVTSTTPLDTTDAETETMTTITKPDGRTVTVPIPVPLPTILPPPDDDDDGDKDGSSQS
ncbi:hypothetical protein VP1G_03818 [Cytospora mali]|uniref:Uncharacterized protein n=1 Tax=Cytospora mali TaxID=578113 RepID=A0A194UXQ8_CYTMA|nr:hypothetical protein VP1G_03818 [Valsa mali var. pyri (nom. inval.)]